VALHGVERNTMDVDIVLVLSPGNVDRFVQAAQELGLTPVLPTPIATLRDTQTLRDWHKRRHLQAFGLRASGAAGVTLDVLLFPPIDPQALYQRALRLDIAGTPVRVAAIDDLIALKQHAGRPLKPDISPWPRRNIRVKDNGTYLSELSRAESCKCLKIE